MSPVPLRITVEDGSVSALLDVPAHPLAACVLAHGAGAGMTHAFMAAAADGLAERGTAACASFGGSGRLLPRSL